MKLSAHLSLLFREYEFIERLQRAHAFGFRWVEWWSVPEEMETAVILEVHRLRMNVAGINFYNRYASAAMKGSVNDPGRRAENIKEFERTLDLARRLDARTINILAGRNLRTLPVAKQLDSIADSLQDFASLVDASGITVVMEPLNVFDNPGYLISDLRKARTMIARVGSPAVRLLYDAYHVGMSGDDPVASFALYADVAARVQYAEWPGRRAPHACSRRFASFIRVLAEHHYDGPVGLEFVQDESSTVEDALSFLREKFALALL